MPAGKAEASPVVVILASLISPGDVLRFLALQNRLSNVRVVAVGSIPTLESIGAGQSGKNGSHSIHVFAKAHVVVPFVVDGERLHP